MSTLTTRRHDDPAAAPTTDAGFADLARARAVLLTTYKRDGTPIATPVWLIGRDGALYATTVVASGKVKRIRHTPRVTVAPCTQRGTPTGPVRDGTARLLDPAETATVLAAIRRRYGLFDRLFSLLNRLQGQTEEIAIEISPLSPRA